MVISSFNGYGIKLSNVFYSVLLDILLQYNVVVSNCPDGGKFSLNY